MQLQHSHGYVLSLHPPAPWDLLGTAQADEWSKPTGYYQHAESQASAPKGNPLPAVQARTWAAAPPAATPTPDPFAEASQQGDSPLPHPRPLPWKLSKSPWGSLLGAVAEVYFPYYHLNK